MAIDEELLNVECDPSSGKKWQYQLCITPLNHKPSSEVVFEGDFLHPLSAAFTVRNKSQRTILFKIKTTCPHR